MEIRGKRLLFAKIQSWNLFYTSIIFPPAFAAEPFVCDFSLHKVYDLQM